MKRWEWFLCLPLGCSWFGRAKAVGVWLGELFAASKHRGARLVCDYYDKQPCICQCMVFAHIGGWELCTFPKLANRPQLESRLARRPKQTVKEKKEREKIRNRRARDGGGIPPDRSLYFKPQLRPHFCCRIQAACRFWPSSCRHGLEPTSPQNRPHSSPRRRHHHHHHHHHSRPFRPGSMSRNTRPKNSSAAQQSSWVCLLPELASSPSQP